MKTKTVKGAGLAGVCTRLWSAAGTPEDRSVLEILEQSAAWAAYVANYGPGRSSGPVWVEILGGPVAPIEFGPAA